MYNVKKRKEEEYIQYKYIQNGMNKKIIVLVLIFIIGFIGGLLLSKIGNNTKNSSITNNSYNSSSNTAINNAIISNNTNEIKNNISNNNATVTENKTTNKESNTSTSKNTTAEKTTSGLSTYKAVWQYPNSNYPEQEFEVKSITDTKVDFDYAIDGITTFENASATINGNIAKFDIKNEGDWNIKGTITFENNTVIFKIEESSSENIPTGSTTFTVKSNKSAF